MATILKAEERDFQENPNKIDNFRIFSDMSRVKHGVNPDNLNFDLRKLNPGQYSAPYHFHRYAEELFMIISGSATLRTNNGLKIVNKGDLIFLEKGESGVHQLYNHTDTPCVFLDVRTYIGFDVCEYPDSNKLLLAPTMETFNQNMKTDYFSGEENVVEKWKYLRDTDDLPL
ncbi:cupin domain-containing protein [Bacteroidales bacterium OttesenSCG-928-M11]|nr:cupin domain-containing protein [Bacteroidales bacterium OttesenSCG-928-M11]